MVEGEKVTLSGQVVKAALRDGAEKAVKNIEGIEAVDNKIQVLPLSADDDLTQELEYAAIYSFPSLYMPCELSHPSTSSSIRGT
jgi:hyperosmotically inducible protein